MIDIMHVCDALLTIYELHYIQLFISFYTY